MFYFITVDISVRNSGLDFNATIQLLECMELKNRQQRSNEQNKLIHDMFINQNRIGFTMNAIMESLSSTVIPSEDCMTEKSDKYRVLMKALSLCEDNNVASLARSIDYMLCDSFEFKFEWGDQSEKASYEPFLQYLKKEFGFNNAIDVSEGQGLADKWLYESIIYTPRPRLIDSTYEFKKAIMGNPIKFIIRGRTDIAVFREGGMLTRGNLQIAFEIKPNKTFSSLTDINRALREGVLQLIGCNADNHYISPLVIVTNLCDKHYLLYLELCSNAFVKMKYYLRVRVCDSLAKLIHYAQLLLKRGCVTTHFATPPIPGCEEEEEISASENESDDDFSETNVCLEIIDD